MKVYEVLAEVFRRERVDTCFALLGDANMNWATILSDKGARMVYLRHEHCAVSAAMSYARASRDVGVASVTCGPGVTQILTALPAAVRAGIPLVIFAGEAPLGAAWYNQQIDQGPLVEATGAAYVAVHQVPSMPRVIRDAFIQAREEERPVVVGVPFDLQDEDWTGGDMPTPSHEVLQVPAPIPPDPRQIEEVARLLRDAQRIVVLAGRGAVLSCAGNTAHELARRIGALTATTLPARGLFHDDAHCLGIAGGFSTAVARAAMAEADLVLTLGGSLASHNTDKGKLFPKAKVIQIDTTPRTIAQGRVAADLRIRADARVAAQALLDTLDITPRTNWRTDAMARAIAETPADTASFPSTGALLDPRDVAAELDRTLPKEWEMVNSSGHCSYYFAQMNGRPNETFHTIREFGAIGNGISYAIGVAAARPNNRVVLFDGDGSLLMHVQEIETIRRTGLNILICVMNDNAYGSEIHKLRDEGLSDAGAIFGPTDLASIARGFGIAGHRVADLTSLPDHIAEWTQTGGAMVLDFPVSDRIASPVVRRAHPKGHDAVEQPVDLGYIL